MKRALLAVCLMASPAAAQVGSNLNPFNPYGGQTSGGHVQLRPYVSPSRLNVQYQSRMMPIGYGATSGTISTAFRPLPPATAFGYYPNYPLLNSPARGNHSVRNVSAKNLQPRPFTAPRPVETACDPYLDNDGCLSEFAGLGF